MDGFWCCGNIVIPECKMLLSACTLQYCWFRESSVLLEAICLFSSLVYALMCISEFDFSALTLLVGRQEEHPAHKILE